jgi:hypothetical protein
MRKNQRTGDFILDGGSVVTDMQIESERGEFGIREALPRSGWTQARSMARGGFTEGVKIIVSKERKDVREEER